MAGGRRRLIEVDRFSLRFSPSVAPRSLPMGEYTQAETRGYVVHDSDFHRSPVVSLRPLLRRTNFSSCCRPPFSPDEFKVNLGHETEFLGSLGVAWGEEGVGDGGWVGAPGRPVIVKPLGAPAAHPDLSVTIEPWETGALGSTIRLGHL